MIQNVKSIAAEVDTTKHNNIYEIMILTMHSLLSFDSGFRLHREFCTQLASPNYEGFFDKLNGFLTTINNDKLQSHKYIRLSNPAIESILSIFCSLLAYDSTEFYNKSHTALSEALFANILKYSSKNYVVPSPKDASSNPNNIIFWGGIQVKLGTEVITKVCEHYCLSRLLDMPNIRLLLTYQLDVFVQEFDITGNILDEDATYFFCKILFKLTFETSILAKLERMNISRTLYQLMITSSNERLLMVTLMVIESIFEKKYKLIIMKFYSTEIMEKLNSFGKKPYTDTDISKSIKYIHSQMVDYLPEYNTIERFKYEINYGVLRMSMIHDRRFLCEQAKYIEAHEKEYIIKLMEIVATKISQIDNEDCDYETLATAMADLTYLAESSSIIKTMINNLFDKSKVNGVINCKDKMVTRYGIMFANLFY
eukprot:Mrub_02807.p1 GENE.Mrub_02807~~Mrub_02807.p1  ORF type:complete len:499 (-),score=67.55 Mrub_02807:113-1387(-)